MKILSNVLEIEKKLHKLIISYRNISMATAWASANSKAFKTLISKNNKSKIKHSTIGLHFYQTDPSFIEEFLDSHDMKFYKQEKGVFHPKIYLFWNTEDDWVCLSGSANFTQSALTSNSEIMTLFTKDDGVEIKEIKSILHSYFWEAKTMSKDDLNQYKNGIKENKKDTNDNFKHNNIDKKIVDIEWSEYLLLLGQQSEHLENRLRILKQTRTYFKKPFQKLTELQRKNIGGVKKRGDKDNIPDWFVFGRMPVQQFANRLSDADNYGESGKIKSFMKISKALDCIPSTGEVRKQDFDKCMKYFKEYDGWGYRLSTVSRLLAMKRPDQFFCITGIYKQEGNFKGFQKHFGKPKRLKTYDDYWEYVIENIRETKWYDVKEPLAQNESAIWKGRVALLDTLLYNN